MASRLSFFYILIISFNLRKIYSSLPQCSRVFFFLRGSLPLFGPSFIQKCTKGKEVGKMWHNARPRDDPLWIAQFVCMARLLLLYFLGYNCQSSHVHLLLLLLCHMFSFVWVRMQKERRTAAEMIQECNLVSSLYTFILWLESCLLLHADYGVYLDSVL